MSIDIIYWAMEEAEWPNPIQQERWRDFRVLNRANLVMHPPRQGSCAPPM